MLIKDKQCPLSYSDHVLQTKQRRGDELASSFHSTFAAVSMLPVTKTEATRALQTEIRRLERKKDDAHRLMESSRRYVETRLAAGNEIGVIVSAKHFFRYEAEKRRAFIAIIRLKQLFTEILLRKDSSSTHDFESAMNAIVAEADSVPAPTEQLDKSEVLELARWRFKSCSET